MRELDGTASSIRAVRRPEDASTGGCTPADEQGGPFRRVLVPVESLQASTNALSVGARTALATGGSLRLIHVRRWDPRLPRGDGRLYGETSVEATAVLEAAMTYVWARGVEASGVVIDAQWSEVASAILVEASEWGADVIVLTVRPRRLLTVGVWDKVTREVMRGSSWPVLVVYPRRP